MFFHLHHKTTPGTGTGKQLLSRDFFMLFFLALFSNCYLSVYYCFEQWLEHVSVAPSWRGVLLGALFGMLLVVRPPAVLLLLRCNRLPVVIASLLASTGVLFCYSLLDPTRPNFEWFVLGLRLVQGFSQALLSTCVVSVLVSCIPPGQSARGFALFSITFLLPYGVIPSLGEFLLPIVGSEPHLFSLTGLLVVPCLVMTILLAPRLSRPEVTGADAVNFGEFSRRLLRGVTHSGLSLVYLSIISFSLATGTCIFFMKGLCSQTGGNPAIFFFFYTSTMIVLRIFGNKMLDRLPCYRVVPLTAATMSLSVLCIAWAPLWAYTPATIVYGISLALLYPLSASVVYNRSTPETRTVNSNLMMMGFDFSNMGAPMIGGAIISMGFDYHGVITFAACMLCCCGTLFALDGLVQARRAKA